MESARLWSCSYQKRSQPQSGYDVCSYSKVFILLVVILLVFWPQACHQLETFSRKEAIIMESAWVWSCSYQKRSQPQSGYDVCSYSKVFMFYKISGNFLKGACVQSVLSKKFVNKRKANSLCQRVSGYIFLVQK